MVIINSSHHRRSALQKRCSQLQYPSHRRRNAVPPEKNVKIIFYNLAHLGQRLYDLSFIHGVRVLRSQWAHYLVDIARGLVSIGLNDAWSPHCNALSEMVRSGHRMDSGSDSVNRMSCGFIDLLQNLVLVKQYNCDILRCIFVYIHITVY